MALYRVFYFDARGNVFSAADFEANNDQGAIDRAVTLLGASVAIFEIWQRDRFIHRHPTDDYAVSGRKPTKPLLERLSSDRMDVP